MKRLLTGEQIHNIRRRLGETQKQFAKRLGVQTVTVCLWETNKRRCGEKFSEMIRAIPKPKGARVRWEKQNIGGAKVLVQLPDEMRDMVDIICKEEMRTISDMVRESLRRYIADWKRTAPAKVRLDMIYETMEIEEPAVKD